MSAESGVPTYRGKGGIWAKYNWEEVACEEAFQRNPEKVLEFHAHRRQMLAECSPHAGHRIVTAAEDAHHHTVVVTQNIDGLHQLAGSRQVIELHGSLWRVRCPDEGTIYQLKPGEEHPFRCKCGAWLRPDIVWFGDSLDPVIVNRAVELVTGCNLLMAVGTSGVVWPSAGFPQLARDNGAYCIEINLESTGMSHLYDQAYYGLAGEILPALFPDIGKL